MSDETPRGPIRETPAARLDSREAPDSRPRWRGIMAALGLFVAFVMVEFAAVAAASDSVGKALDAALLVAAPALAAAVLVSRCLLPRASRAASWDTGIGCIAFLITALIIFCVATFTPG